MVRDDRVRPLWEVAVLAMVVIVIAVANAAVVVPLA
jgi:type IV secretory pathway component VirB8